MYYAALVSISVLFLMIFALKDDYWMIIPFALTANIGAIPLGGRTVSFAELAIPCVAVVYFIRQSTRSDFKGLFQKISIFMLGYVAWAFIRYKQENIGLMILGGGDGGGARTYITIGIAFIGYLIMSSQYLNEQKCRKILNILIASSVIGTVVHIVRYFFVGQYQIIEDEDTFYTWQQGLGVVALFMIPYIFAKYTPKTLLKELKIRHLILLAILFCCAAVSGKRAVMAACIAAPIVMSLLRREVITAMFCVFAIGLGMIGVIVSSYVVQLPLTIQRSVSWLPGDWDQEVLKNTENSFRRTLNDFAIDEISKSPVLGRGFKIGVDDIMYLNDPEVINELKMPWEHVAAFSYAYSGNYHSTWLGISATLGIPAAVLMAFIYLQSIILSWKGLKKYQYSTNYSVLSLVLFYIVIVALVRSGTSGHAGESYMYMSWVFGLLVAMRRSTKLDQYATNHLSENDQVSDANER